MGTKAQELARFIRKTQYKHLDEETLNTLRRSLLDTFGVAIAAIEAPPLRALRVHANDFNPTGTSTLIGDGRGAPDIAAFYNAGLIGYLDFQDGYMARNECAHPSMILGGILFVIVWAGIFYYYHREIPFSIPFVGNLARTPAAPSGGGFGASGSGFGASGAGGSYAPTA